MNLAKVVAIHPETNTVDLLVLDDNRRLPGIRVMSPEASSGTGLTGLVMPSSQNTADPYDQPFDGNRDTIACVAYYQTVPIVIGFLYPTVTQVLFSDMNRHMHRTASDFYHTVDGGGNAEWFHPGGAYIRIATASEHEDLTGKDFQKKWKIAKNTDKQVHIHIEQAGGVASVDIAPNGAIVINSNVSLTVNTPTTTVNSDEVTVNSTTTTVNAEAVVVNADTVTANADTVTSNATITHCTGALNVDGKITGSGGLAISGGGGATVNGDMTISSGNVTADGISLKTHTHGGVQSGGSPTGTPQ